MKRNPVHRLLPLLLVFALLLQGHAAAAMSGCLSAAGGRPGVALEDARSPAMTMPGMSPGADGHCPHASVGVPRGAGDAGQDEAPDFATASHSCSACAAACIGGALMASAPRLPALRLHERPLSATFADTAFITEGPERPPRPFLA